MSYKHIVGALLVVVLLAVSFLPQSTDAEALPECIVTEFVFVGTIPGYYYDTFLYEVHYESTHDDPDEYDNGCPMTYELSEVPPDEIPW